MNCADFFLENSKDLEKNLVLGRYETISYRELYKKVIGLASYLHKKIGSGKNVVIISDNSVFFIISYLAVIKSNNICIPLNPNINKESLDKILQLCQPGLIFCQKKRLGKLEGKEIETVDEESYSDFKGNGAELSVSENEDAIAEIIFTSGSTGDPQGVMLSHKNLTENTKSILAYLKLNKEDVMEVVLPFFYCYGLSLLHTHLRVGASIVLNNEFIFFNRLFEDIQKYKCTGFAGVPSHFQLLLRKSRLKEQNFSSLKYVTQAGGKLPDIFIKEFTEAFPEIRFYVMYGQTEATARLAYLEPEKLQEKLGSLGKAIPNVKLEVLNREGKIVKPGEVGEIVASGDNIMKGYLKNEEETKKVLREGRLYTGDLARVDEEGYIYLVGREKEIIKVGGFRVSPKEVEDVISQIKGVMDCTVTMVEDEILGEALKAYVVLDGNSTTDKEIKSYCSQRLQTYKVPKIIEFINNIPVNAVGKKITGKIYYENQDQ